MTKPLYQSHTDFDDGRAKYCVRFGINQNGGVLMNMLITQHKITPQHKPSKHKYRASFAPNGEIQYVTADLGRQKYRFDLRYDHQKGVCTIIIDGYERKYPISLITDHHYIELVKWAYDHLAIGVTPKEYSDPIKRADITAKPKTVGYITKKPTDMKKATYVPTQFLASAEKTVKGRLVNLGVHENGVVVKVTSKEGKPRRNVYDTFVFDNEGTLTAHIKYNWNRDVVFDESYQYPKQDPLTSFVDAMFGGSLHYKTNYKCRKWF